MLKKAGKVSEIGRPDLRCAMMAILPLACMIVGFWLAGILF